MNNTLSHQDAQRHNRSSLLIVDGYFKGEFAAPSAIRELSSKGVVGRYWMGEVCLQEATVRSSDPGHFLERADEYYKSVVYQAPINKPSVFTSYASKAAIRKSQISLYRPLIAKQRMPQPRTVQEAYGKLIRDSSVIRDLTANHNRSAGPKTLRSDSAIQTGGLINELAVLLLSMRYALQNDCTDAWLPVQALPGEDIGTTEQTESRSKWDMTVWQPGDSAPEKAYKVQVKSSAIAHIDSPQKYSPDITMLHVDPDLQIPGSYQRRLGSVIITECAVEFMRPEAAAGRVSQRLDVRTEQLLTKLDQ